MGFSAIYLALPTITGAVFGTPLEILPIPFVDWSPYTKDILPAVATGLSLNMAQLITGMVMPYRSINSTESAISTSSIRKSIPRSISDRSCSCASSHKWHPRVVKSWTFKFGNPVRPVDQRTAGH